jgi:hypothetical protein
MAQGRGSGLGRKTLVLTVAAAAATVGLGVSAGPAAAAPVPEITVGDASIHEGDVGKRIVRVMVNLDQTSPSGVSANWSTTGGTAASGVDFKARSGKLYFRPGQTTRYAKINVNPDAVTEGDQQFSVTLSGVVGATVGDGTGTVTIVDDEAATGAEVSIGDATVVEGLNGESRYVWLSISLNQPAGTTASVTYSTGGGDSEPEDEYDSRTSTVTFRPKARVKYALVYLHGDAASEDDEGFNVTLSSPVNLTIGDGTGTVTIVDDD